jgi:hypothetical protein
MPGQLPNTSDKIRKRHDKLVQGISGDLQGTLERGRSFESNFQRIHRETEKLAHTAFAPVNRKVTCAHPKAQHLVDHIHAVHQHSRALAKSTLPHVVRRDMTPQEVRSQRRAIGNIRGLVNRNRQHLAALLGHMDKLHAKLAELEKIYS